MVKAFDTSLLASRQDLCLSSLGTCRKIPSSTIEYLEHHPWVLIARKLAPSNLVIRTDCILDLVSGIPSRRKAIAQQIDKLCLTTNHLWAEGYSYWKYTKAALLPYYKKFGFFGPFVRKIDRNFRDTSYEVDGVLYPAPFGDLRHEPLEEHLQTTMFTFSEYSAPPIVKHMRTYKVSANPVGLNCHCPSENQIWTITPTGNVCDPKGNEFPWYTGYPAKYKNKISEITDLLKPTRIFSIFRRR